MSEWSEADHDLQDASGRLDEGVLRVGDLDATVADERRAHDDRPVDVRPEYRYRDRHHRTGSNLLRRHDQVDPALSGFRSSLLL